MLSAATKSHVALRYRALSITLALLLQPCIGPCEQWYSIDIGSKADITRAPFDINLSDMKWAVGAYKPRDLATGEKLDFTKGDKRFVFRGKKTGLGNFAEFGGIDGRGTFSLGITYALDDTKGLRSGETSAWAYANYREDGEPTINYQINLQYQDELDDGENLVPGWVARAYRADDVESVLLGQMEFPGAASLDVRLLQETNDLSFLARETPADVYGAELEVEFQVVHTMERAVAVDGFDVGFGAFGLDKGGEIYGDKLWFLGPQLMTELGEEEVFAFGAFSNIGSCLTVAKEALTVSEINPEVDLADVSEARSLVSDALSTAISTMFSLKQDLKDGEFEYAQAAKTASKIGKQTYKKLEKVEKKLDKMLEKRVVNTKQLKGICKCLESLIDRSFVGQANMFGVNVKKFSQLENIAYMIPEGDLPLLFD